MPSHNTHQASQQAERSAGPCHFERVRQQSDSTSDHAHYFIFPLLAGVLSSDTQNLRRILKGFGGWPQGGAGEQSPSDWLLGGRDGSRQSSPPPRSWPQSSALLPDARDAPQDSDAPKLDWLQNRRPSDSPQGSNSPPQRDPLPLQPPTDDQRPSDNSASGQQRESLWGDWQQQPRGGPTDLPWLQRQSAASPSPSAALARSAPPGSPTTTQAIPTPSPSPANPSPSAPSKSPSPSRQDAMPILGALPDRASSPSVDTGATPTPSPPAIPSPSLTPSPTPSPPLTPKPASAQLPSPSSPGPAPAAVRWACCPGSNCA